MRVAVFSDVHAHADALDAVLRAAVEADVRELWSLGDMVGTGPDPARVVAAIRAYCTVALVGNHDYGVVKPMDPASTGRLDPATRRSIELAARALGASGDLDWRARKPAARRPGVQCWHASPRNAVHEYVGAANVAACLRRQRAPVGLIGHTHAPAAWEARPGGSVRPVRVRPGEALDLSGSKWLLNPGAVGAPIPSAGDWWQAMEAHARAGAWWLELDVDARLATWRRAAFDPEPARERARAAGLDRHPAGALVPPAR
jgi:predicted phosphodiesterase